MKDEYTLRINGHQKWFKLLGDKWFMDRVFFGEPRKKEMAPLFDGYVDGVVSIRFLDFDHTNVHPDQLRAVGICPFVSMSGRTKGIILINHPNPSDAMTVDTVRKMLGDLADELDLAGLRTSFIHPDQFEALSQFEFKAVDPVWDNHDWRIHKRIEVSDDEDVNTVLSMMASNEGGDEMDLSGKYVAEQNGWSVSRAYRAINKALEGGFIRLIDSSYKIGARARRFALNVARKAEDCLTIVFKSIPKMIEDGMWWRMLLPTMRHFATFEMAESWFKGLDGHDMPGKRRWKKLISAWNHHAKKNSLAPI